MATNFVDGATPLNAEAFNGMEEEIADAFDNIDIIGNRRLNLGITGRTSINSGDDLNDYTTVGSYRAASNNIAASLENAPTSVAFGMWVLQTDSANNLLQLVIVRTGQIYTRYYYNGWYSWNRVSYAS